MKKTIFILEKPQGKDAAVVFLPIIKEDFEVDDGFINEKIDRYDNKGIPTILEVYSIDEDICPITHMDLFMLYQKWKYVWEDGVYGFGKEYTKLFLDNIDKFELIKEVKID